MFTRASAAHSLETPGTTELKLNICSLQQIIIAKAQIQDFKMVKRYYSSQQTTYRRLCPCGSTNVWKQHQSAQDKSRPNGTAWLENGTILLADTWWIL
jgi:hypothetical protein